MVTYTSSSTYWSPLKPRIRIYAFSDSTYSNPLYTYNAFTDTGSTTKPISLSFDSQTTNVGTFSVEIEDTASALDPDTLLRGNRIFIECSKDGSAWQPAFKGLVRSSDQNIYAPTGRNLVLQGYSYLVRLNERVLNTIKESSVIAGDYDRTDSDMFTNNLINDLLTTNANYVYSDDDTALYSIFKKTNISSSPITEWIPRLDAQLVTVNDALNSVLEFSNGLVMLNPADDELVLYNPDLITSATGIFLLTNQMNQNADDADYTMYPLEQYKYNISYDYPESGSRLIGSIGNFACPEIIQQPIDTPCTNYPTSYINNFTFYSNTTMIQYNYMYACEFQAMQPDMTNLRIEVANANDISHVPPDSFKAQIRTKSGPTHPNNGTQIGSDMILYRNRTIGAPFPDFKCCSWHVGLPFDETGVQGLEIGTTYWLVVWISYGFPETGRWVGWLRPNISYLDAYMIDVAPTGWPDPTSSGWNQTTANQSGLDPLRDGPFTFQEMDFGEDILQEECGGTQATKETDPVFAVAHDRNMSNRLGVVEKVITGIPTHIKTAQVLREYLANKLYYAAKPRFTFDFPSVSMPNKLPKAGDIVAHVDTKANVGLRNAPVQTGVISSVSYDFAQGDDGVLGLRKIGLQTTGIRRGSY